MRALTLDLWHTLVYIDPESEEQYMRRQVEIAVAALEAAPPTPGSTANGPADFQGAFEEAYTAAVAASQRGLSVSPAAQIEQAGRRVGRQPDLPAYLATLHELVGTLRFQPAPDVTDVLRTLKDGGWSLGVVSNTVGEPGTSLEPMLRRLGFFDLISTWVFSDQQPWTKPAAEIFHLAADRLGVPVSQTAHVGDGWVEIAGAQRAGMAAAFLFTGLQQYGERYRRLFLPAGGGTNRLRRTGSAAGASSPSCCGGYRRDGLLLAHVTGVRDHAGLLGLGRHPGLALNDVAIPPVHPHGDLREGDLEGVAGELADHQALRAAHQVRVHHRKVPGEDDPGLPEDDAAELVTVLHGYAVEEPSGPLKSGAQAPSHERNGRPML